MKRKERATTTQKIKVWERSYGSPVTTFSAHTHYFIDWLQQGCKDCWKNLAERHKIASITAEGCFPAVINSRNAEGKVCLRVETPWWSPCLAVKWLVHLCCHTAILNVCHRVLPMLHYRLCPGTGLSLSHPLWSLCVHVCTSLCTR